MTRDIDSLARRVDAIERAVGATSADGTPAAPTDPAPTATDLEARIEAVEDRLEAVESRLDDLDGAVQAVRGYAGAVRAVNQSVERRADLALAKAERRSSVDADGAPTAPAGADRADESGLVVERVADSGPPPGADAAGSARQEPSVAGDDGRPPGDREGRGVSGGAERPDNADRWPAVEADAESAAEPIGPGDRSPEGRGSEETRSLAERLRDAL